MLDGRKMWITNGSIADVAVVWANAEDGRRRDPRVRRSDGRPRASPRREIKHKMSLRASVTSELVLDGVRLPASAVLPEVRGLKGPLSCLNEARYGIVWGALGAARSSLESALALRRRASAVRPADRRASSSPRPSWPTWRWS